MLTPDYIDKLVAAGMTDIGMDIKAARLETFAKISGLSSSYLTRRLLQQTWRSVEYLLEHYRDRIFIGIGIVYNNSLITIEEVREIASRLLAIDSSVQVCLLDYRPEFRSLDIKQPSPGQMLDVWKLLKGMGLECVICQTSAGYFGP
jgi:pyruvate formate lyase activating enzyme